jgi:hypothetical protein
VTVGREAYPAPGSAGRPDLAACAQNGILAAGWQEETRTFWARLLGYAIATSVRSFRANHRAILGRCSWVSVFS